MQVEITAYPKQQVPSYPMATSGLIQSTIVLAPDLVDMPRLITNFKSIYSIQFRNLKFNRMLDLANNSKKASEDTEKIKETFNEIIKNFQRALLQKEVTFKSEGERQACMWLLCTIFCDNLKLPDKKNVFYSGIGFGEFWALTYRMYQNGQISFREALWLTKTRGDRMSLLTEKYYRISVKEVNRKNLNALISKKSNVGMLSLKNDHYYLYGTQRDLDKVAKSYKVKLEDSIPYFTQYYSQLIRSYAKRFPCAESAVDSQIILFREAPSIEKLLISQCCNGFNERILREEIACYEPFSLKEI